MIRTVLKYTDGRVYLEDTEVESSNKILQPGVYEFEYDEYGRFKNFTTVKIPKVYPLMPSNELENIQAYFDTFLSQEYRDLCTRANILKKTGVLLHGKQGIGKSNYINSIIDKCIKEHNACVFNITSARDLAACSKALKDLRGVQDTLFIVVMEEMDELFTEPYVEGVLKNFMDGINSVDNLMFLGTTNYIEQVPKALKERPSRFKKVLEIIQTDDIDKLKEWLSQTYRGFIEDLTEADCEHLHEMTINKTIDEIKHVLIDYRMKITSLDNKRKLGFKK